MTDDTKLTRDDIIDLADQISPVPEKIKVLPTEILMGNIAINAELLSQMIDHDLRELNDALEEMNQHLIEVPHDFSSPCWARRTEFVQQIELLTGKQEQVERLLVAIRQFINPQPLN